MKGLYEMPLLEIIQLEGDDIICNSTTTIQPGDYIQKNEGATDFDQWS